MAPTPAIAEAIVSVWNAALAARQKGIPVSVPTPDEQDQALKDAGAQLPPETDPASMQPAVFSGTAGQDDEPVAQDDDGPERQVQDEDPHAQ